jgi:hypothetical protein
MIPSGRYSRRFRLFESQKKYLLPLASFHISGQKGLLFVYFTTKSEVSQRISEAPAIRGFL